MMSTQRANGHPPAAGIPPRREDAGDDAAVDAQPRVRRQDDRDRIVGVQLPLVDDVVQPATDQRRDGHDDDPVADHIRVLAGEAREADEHEVRDGEADRVHQPVPADAERAELERDRDRGGR